MTGAEVFTIPAVDFSLGVAGGLVVSETQYQIERAWIEKNKRNDSDYVHAIVWSCMAEVGASVCAVVLFAAAVLEQRIEVAGFCVGYLADKVRWLDRDRALLRATNTR
ncbi:hypothetical protein KBD69_02405 [Candidatus Woesebacteria bacterium]|nr:hypothetical protein [Candidatus Woesebacteria bacterium]